MSFIPSREEARKIMQDHNQEAFHRQHSETVGAVLAEFAKKYDPDNEDFWFAVGILHDLDYEEFPDEHCVKTEQMLKDLDVDPAIIHAVCSHGWGLTGTSHQPESQMEKILFAADELTGLIWSAALMRPSKSCQDMELKSLKKKFKDKRFAAGCNRDVITQGAENLGWELDDLLQQTLDAMKAVEGTF